MAQAGTAPAIDLSTPAQQRFRAEWDFEAITEADNAIDAKRILDAGIAACGAHLAKPGVDPGAVADVVTSEFGLSGSGGQAATRAALRALRTAQERGYLTHWDRMVQGSQNEIARTRDSQQTSATRAGPGRGALLPPLPMSLPHGPRLMYEDKEMKWRSLEF